MTHLTPFGKRDKTAVKSGNALVCETVERIKNKTKNPHEIVAEQRVAWTKRKLAQIQCRHLSDTPEGLVEAWEVELARAEDQLSAGKFYA